MINYVILGQTKFCFIFFSVLIVHRTFEFMGKLFIPMAFEKAFEEMKDALGVT
jgi:hypothetical protein